MLFQGPMTIECECRAETRLDDDWEPGDIVTCECCGLRHVLTAYVPPEDALILPRPPGWQAQMQAQRPAPASKRPWHPPTLRRWAASDLTRLGTVGRTDGLSAGS